MKLSKLFSQEKPTLSFEVFPPKTSDFFQSVEQAALEIASLSPDYMSVTYGAGGGRSRFTVDIAKEIERVGNTTALAHLTCVTSTKEDVREKLLELREAGIENILALRGDIPKEGDYPLRKDYRYACELIREIREFGDFCIGGACYPEGHTEAKSLEEDIANIGIKVEAGCEFLTTQMFFNNDILYDYIDKLHKKGIFVPVVAGIMPITNARQIYRSCELSGTVLPKRFIKIAERYGDNPAAMKQAGIAYATEQIIDLYANGVKNVHVYSMNKPDVARIIKNNLSEIIRG
ncbi:MAG: methylenetetrahydrofolate reductase [NAD(P)H] [Eubacteriales bacterium]|nr:methylenetetrahydrofolate reductase [NAD(P)H] [Eubacteriales bacterium]